MTRCLVALGSNLGDRAATLDAALADLNATPGVNSVRSSRWHATKPVGSSALAGEFLNGAAAFETNLEPGELHEALQRIEARHGRQRHERWGNRTLDLDPLLYGDRVVTSPTLTLPHPRMSFRRFVLEPACEIAGDWLHPTIGATLEQLLHQLDAGADCLAIVSFVEAARAELAATLASRRLGTPVAPPLYDPLWPASHTTWLKVFDEAAIHGLPKLSILLEPEDGTAAWAALAKRQGRGPTLQIVASDRRLLEQEAFAAVEAVWPRLGPTAG
jgi:2-amino-4-hydroxy-6-hydroxymethyldihydropteridine diphosphokinase